MRNPIKMICAMLRSGTAREYIAYDALIGRLSQPKAQAELTGAYRKAGVRYI